MTASTGVGRGKGGGRPRKNAPPKAKAEPKAKAKPIEIPPVSAATRKAARAEADRLAEVGKESTLSPAAELMPLAYATLADVMDNSPADASRVSAAKAIIELARAAEAEAREAAGTTGKKAQAQAAAEQHAATGGKFAPPPASHRFQ